MPPGTERPTTDPSLRDELSTALSARRELGEALEPEVIEAYLGE